MQAESPTQGQGTGSQPSQECSLQRRLQGLTPGSVFSTLKQPHDQDQPWLYVQNALARDKALLENPDNLQAAETRYTVSRAATGAKKVPACLS